MSFDDIITFIVGEINMRVYQILSGELNNFDPEDQTLEGYSKVRQGMTKADCPAYERPCPYPKNTAGHLGNSFDPSMDKLIEGFNKNC